MLTVVCTLSAAREPAREPVRREDVDVALREVLDPDVTPRRDADGAAADEGGDAAAALAHASRNAKRRYKYLWSARRTVHEGRVRLNSCIPAPRCTRAVPPWDSPERSTPT